MSEVDVVLTYNSEATSQFDVLSKMSSELDEDLTYDEDDTTVENGENI
jgi:hypothetical protein